MPYILPLTVKELKVSLGQRTASFAWWYSAACDGRTDGHTTKALYTSPAKRRAGDN